MKSNIIQCALNLINEESEKRKLNSTGANIGAEIGRGIGHTVGTIGSAVGSVAKKTYKKIKDNRK